MDELIKIMKDFDAYYDKHYPYGRSHKWFAFRKYITKIVLANQNREPYQRSLEILEGQYNENRT